MGPLTGLPDLPGVDRAGDQVVRLMAFRKAHPEWRIAVDREYGLWRALRLRDGGEDNHVRYELRDLLDAMEAHCRDEADPAAASTEPAPPASR